MSKRLFYTWAIGFVVCTLGAGVVLGILFPWWISIPISLVVGSLIGSAAGQLLRNMLLPSGDEPDTIDPSTTEGPE
jgi:ABC-type xylose transport system permease subunit